MLLSTATLALSLLCLPGSPAASTRTGAAPVLRCVDALDGDRALSLQNGLVRVVLLQALNVDSLVSVSFGGRFDPEKIEILEILPGTAWDQTDHTAQVFQRTIDPAAGTWEVITGVLGSSAGLSGAGPYTFARLRLRAADDALTSSSRWAHQRLTLDRGMCGLSGRRGPIQSDWGTQDLLLRFGYLGDLATGWMGADSVPPHLVPRPDGRIHFEDQLVFTLGWNGVNGVRDPIADIGPVTGTAPDLISNPDRMWDVDDILAFTTMYSWDVESGREPHIPVLADDRIKGHLLRTGPRIAGRIVSSQCGRESELVLDLVGGMDLTGVQVILAWDPAVVTPGESFSTGLLAGADGEIFLACPGTGCLELGLTRLDPVSPGSDASGTLISMPFRWSGAGDPGWTVFWDLYDHRCRPVSWGHWRESGVHHSIHLHSPRPNPSSRGSMLGFQLEPGLSGRLEVFDVGGRLLRRFGVTGDGGSGQQIRFDGLDEQGRMLAPGVYFLRLEAAGQSVHHGLVIGP